MAAMMKYGAKHVTNTSVQNLSIVQKKSQHTSVTQMTKPHLQKFIMPINDEPTPFTSVILDQKDFDTFCDELSDVKLLDTGGTPSEEQIELLREAKHLPMMMKGAMTKKFFDQWGVETEYLGVIVRGAARRMGFDPRNN